MANSTEHGEVVRTCRFQTSRSIWMLVFTKMWTANWKL